jgi:pyruvate,water dikinase
VDKLYWLDQIKPQNRAEVGDKAFHLSRLIQCGYPVAPGFVVSAAALREFLENLNSSEALIADLPDSSLHLDVNNWRQLQQVASRLRQEIITATVPANLLKTILQAARELKSAFLILRPTIAVPTAKYSSGNLSGLLESQFCRCDEEAIAQALKCTWSELFRARSLFYWQRSGIDLQQIHLAVLVQPLENAIASGSLHASSDQWEIQATWGLGIAITKGEVLPEVYYIQPDSGAIKEQQLGNKMLAYQVDEVASTETTVQDAPILTADTHTSLVVQLLEEAQQNQYALPEEYLQQLIYLANQLVKELGTNFVVEWTIPATETKKLTITQLSISQEPTPNFQLIKGLGAARGRVMGPAYVIVDPLDSQQLAQIPKGAILVASVLEPNWLPVLQQISGIVTEQGGLTSHAAILARELSIPAVVSVPDATTIIQNGERLLIDGDQGEIYPVTKGVSDFGQVGELEELKSKTQSFLNDGKELNLQSRQSIFPTELAEEHPEVGKAERKERKRQVSEGYLQVGETFRQSPIEENSEVLFVKDMGSPGNTNSDFSPPPIQANPHTNFTIQNSLPTIATQLLLNLSQPNLIEKVQGLPVDGVGLLRSELMVLNILEGKHPNTWLWEGRKTQLLERWCELIMQFARGFAPRPVFYRSLDWRSQELLSFNHSLKSSAQRTLGERGTFSYIGNPAIFELELEALATLQKAGYTNIQLLLPFVRTVEEFSFCRRKVEQAMLYQLPQFQLWIMAEVPSILFLLPEYVKAGVHGISIGTNDLTQLLLGVDREQGHLATVFNERHPAVMSAIAQIIQMATNAGIPCSICGQAPALYPEIIEQLVKWGITSISVEPEAVEQTYQAIIRAEQKLILQAARRQLNQ